MLIFLVFLSRIVCFFATCESKVACTNSFYLQRSIDKEAIREVINTRNISKNDLIRKNEAIFKDLKLNLDELFTNQIIDIICANPILLERPLLIKYVDNSFVKSIIGRPPESILTLFD